MKRPHKRTCVWHRNDPLEYRSVNSLVASATAQRPGDIDEIEDN